MRRLADQRDTVAGEAARRLDRERKQPAPWLDLHFSEKRMRAPFDLDGKLFVVHREQLGGARRVEHADEARAPPGQRDEREWSAFGVKLGRRVFVRPRVGEIERQRASADRRGDRCRCRPRRGTANAARRRRPTSRARTVLSASSMVTPAGSLATARAGRGDARNIQLRCTLLQRRDEMTVLDIVAEGVEADLGGGEHHLRRAHQPPGVVDDADRLRAARRAAGTHPMRRVSQARSPNRPAARWCDDRPRRGGAISTVSTPAVASAMALTRPAGPPPITATSAVWLSLAVLTNALSDHQEKSIVKAAANEVLRESDRCPRGASAICRARAGRRAEIDEEIFGFGTPIAPKGIF